MESNRPLSLRLHLDVPLLAALAALAAIGLVTLYSAAGESSATVLRQGIRLGLGFAVMILVAQVPPGHLLRWSPWLYALGLVLLASVLVAGDVAQGAQRWIRVAGFKFQPSEMAKITVPLMLAWFIAERPLPPSLWRLIAGGTLVVVPAVLIAKEPDLGTALLVASSGGFVLFLAGLSWRLLGALAVLGAAAAPVLWMVMHDYQRQRVLTFLDPEKDPLGAGYHIIQSKIAIGSGGLYGKGWLNGTQSQLDFLPERSTDFIFAVFSEEFGLLGVLVLLALYLFVVGRGLLLSAQAQESSWRLLAGALTLTFFVYVFVNIGMVSGLLPVVGLPLPLLSYGGTSLVTLMAAFGIVMSAFSHRRLLSQ